MGALDRYGLIPVSEGAIGDYFLCNMKLWVGKRFFVCLAQIHDPSEYLGSDSYRSSIGWVVSSE